jgi:anti-anti-sigma factor
MGEEMEVQVDIGSDGVATLVVTGEIDLAVAGELAAAVDKACGIMPTALLIDLAGVTYCDSSGIAQFLRAAQTCAHHGADCRVINASSIVQRVFHAAGLDAMLQPLSDGR